MPITELRSASILQDCAACEAQQEVPFSALAAGANRDTVIDPYIIALPTCPGCGAREFLIRTAYPDEIARIKPGSYGHLHRLLVDRLHHHLIEQARVIEGAIVRELEKLPRTDEELEKWLPDGLILPRLPS